MGIEIARTHFEADDHDRFARKLERSLAALELLLRRPGFGEGAITIGTELEVHLVDSSGRPARCNQEVVTTAADPRVTLEMNRYNVEINTRPTQLSGRPFTAMEKELGEALEITSRSAREHGAEIAMVGILPTLTEADLQSSALSDRCRYRALSNAVRRLRKEPIPVQIAGEEILDVSTDDVTFEGANTSFQVHLRVTPEAFARTYNAAQIATAFVLAVSGNSPLFLERRLWDETRIALFRGAVDERESLDESFRPARVSFGHGWARTGAFELFAESVRLHQPLIPQCTDVDPLEIVRGGGVPALAELRLHHGTVWRWNRAVYDDHDGGHLRIELRTLPSGPTVRDMVANAALAIGLTRSLANCADKLVTQMTFGQARHSFYNAARAGLDAELLWPGSGVPSPTIVSPLALAREAIPLARIGLVDGGVEAPEADHWLGIIAERVARGATGARWQRHAFDTLARTRSRRDAALEMFARYRELSRSGAPVHEWPLLSSGASAAVRSPH